MTRSGETLGRLALIAVAVMAIVVIAVSLQSATRQPTLPLKEASIIRQQATAKQLDPALVAGVIYAETKFEPRPSPAGAQGLMQILPATAYYLARLSGGYRFTATDLATPRVNIAYGSYYLRYLLDHYHGDEMRAVAAYNAGLANVDRWSAKAREGGNQLAVSEIPFAETREYVQRVLDAQRRYRATYPTELGLR
jgi:soluble lytic murein transglycosylase